MSFRPLAGDLSSLLQNHYNSRRNGSQFPSPCRGLIFLTRMNSRSRMEQVSVSVPLQGTYLPYDVCASLYDTCFGFPSPCRGLIFLTELFRALTGDAEFPSPCRGLIFLTWCFDRTGSHDYGFRPLAGDLSSLLDSIITDKGRISSVSVPLQGTYLPYYMNRVFDSLEEFPSPCRGLIFLT